MLGQLKSFSINAAELEDAFEGGMGFDGSSITGFNPIEESDMIAMPDPSTFALIPWRPEEENAVARMFCDIRVPGGEPYEGDPRWILRRALKRAEELGFDAYNIGPELEYFYFRSAKPEDGVPEVLDEGGYFDLTTLDAGSDVRRETILALEQMGIHVEYTHHEVGPSQHEVDMRYKDALEMADDCMTYRIVGQGVRDEVRLARDLHAEAAVRRERLRHARPPVAHARTARTPSSTPTTSTTSRRPRRRSSPASSSTRARSRRSSPSGSTPTSGSCPATRRRSTSPGRAATARR